MFESCVADADTFTDLGTCWDVFELLTRSGTLIGMSLNHMLLMLTYYIRDCQDVFQSHVADSDSDTFRDSCWDVFLSHVVDSDTFTDF